jgi:colanic acid/amylovoran biosynthesis protein
MHERYVLVTGVTGLRNRGVEALVLSLIEGLRSISDFRIHIASGDSKYDRYIFGDSNILVSPIYNLYPHGWKNKLRKASETLRGVLRQSSQQAFCQLVRGASCVIAIGGDVFSSDYGGLERHLAPLRFAAAHGVPFAILGHSVGPFKTKVEEDSWLEVSQKAAIITLRESLSYEYLVAKLGQRHDNLAITADLAFMLESSWPCDGGNWISCYGFDPGKPLIGVAPSQGISLFKGLDQQAHFEAWHKTLVYLFKNMKAQVILIPHVQAATPENNDLFLAQKLLNVTGHLGQIRIAASHSAAEYKGIVSECDLVLSERMHACIAGLGSCVATHAIGYSVKAEGIMRDMLGTAILPQFLTPVEDFVSHNALLEKLPALLYEKEQVVSVLQSKKAECIALAQKNIDLLKKSMSL